MRATCLAALVVVILWGVNFVAMKWGCAVSAPSSWAPRATCVQRCRWCCWCARRACTGAGCCCSGCSRAWGSSAFLFMGLKVGMTAGLASVLLQTQVFFTALLGFALLRERPGCRCAWAWGWRRWGWCVLR